MPTIKSFIFCFFIFLLPDYLPAQQADDVVKKYVAFIGGEKNWKKLETLTTSGKYNYGGMEFPFTAYAKAPNRYKFIVPLEGKYYAQAFDGEKGWKIDAFKNETTPTMLSGKDAHSMANEADVEIEDVFVDYKRKGHTAAFERNDTINGENCIGIKLTRRNGDVETYFFDEDTGALVMKIAASKNAELRGSLLTTLYSDYRNVEGIKIPFKSVSNFNDQLILEITIDKAEINEAVDDKEFRVPK
jgi:outer membrane lipoprotein-sorting protein